MKISSHRTSATPHAGFSLVELLVVVAIIGLLSALLVPTITGAVRAYSLDTATQAIVAQLSLARQRAIASNRPVQVRLYALPDYRDPTGAPTVYRAVQSFEEESPLAGGVIPLVAVTKVVLFSDPVVIAGGAAPNVSPLLPATPTTAAASDPSLPVYARNYAFASFHFRPDGSTDLASPKTSFTVILQRDPVDGATGLPSNYRSIQVDPMIGTVRVFRP